MISLDVNRLFAELCGGNAFFSYEGMVSSDRINAILDTVETALAGEDVGISVRKKVYNIMVECLQNLYHHSDDVPQALESTLGKSYGLVVLKKENDGFVMHVGNFVLNERVKFLSEKIDKINTISKLELKEMYKFILNYQKLSSKGGGGLGLLDIARKSENRLGYRFYPYNDEYSFYRLDIFVNF